MATANNLKELDQVLELIHRSEKGISYAEMHDVYFAKYGVRLGDHILKPVVDQLKADGFITFRVVPGSDDSYYTLPVAADYLVTGGYQGKSSRESEFLQKDLRIKELELEIEVSKNKIFELESRKNYKGLFIGIIAVLVILLGSSVTYYQGKISAMNGMTTDSLKTDSLSTQQEPVPVSSYEEQKNNPAAVTTDTSVTVVDTIQ